MNKRIKIGLILQIPNLCVLMVILLLIGIKVIYFIPLKQIIYNLPYILIISIFSLINIASLIYFILGLLIKDGI